MERSGIRGVCRRSPRAALDCAPLHLRTAPPLARGFLELFPQQSSPDETEWNPGALRLSARAALDCARFIQATGFTLSPHHPATGGAPYQSPAPLDKAFLTSVFPVRPPSFTLKIPPRSSDSLCRSGKHPCVSIGHRKIPMPYPLFRYPLRPPPPKFTNS